MAVSATFSFQAASGQIKQNRQSQIIFPCLPKNARYSVQILTVAVSFCRIGKHHHSLAATRSGNGQPFGMSRFIFAAWKTGFKDHYLQRLSEAEIPWRAISHLFLARLLSDVITKSE